MQNRAASSSEADIYEKPECVDDIEIGCITRAEIRNAMHKRKMGKAARIDLIITELLKAGVDVTTELLYELFIKFWEKEEIPEDWSNRLIVKLLKRGDLTLL